MDQVTTEPTEHEKFAANVREICDGVADMLIQKNKAYGNSALNPVRIFSKASIVEQLKVRMDDKLSRLAGGHALPDESLTDTVKDLLGYLVIYLVAQKGQ